MRTSQTGNSHYQNQKPRRLSLGRRLRDRRTWARPASGDISEFIHTVSNEILADSEYFNEFCYEVAHKLIDSSYLNTINSLLKICTLYNFFIYKFSEFQFNQRVKERINTYRAKIRPLNDFLDFNNM